LNDYPPVSHGSTSLIGSEPLDCCQNSHDLGENWSRSVRAFLLFTLLNSHFFTFGKDAIMLRFSLSILTVFSFCLGLTGNNAHSEGVSLRYQFKTGQVVRYNVSMDDRYSINVGGVEDEPFTKQDSIKHYRVVKVNADGSAVIELQFESIKIKGEQNGSAFQFDNQEAKAGKEKIEPMFASMAEMIGKPYLQLTVTPSGEVTRVKSLLTDDESELDEAQQAALDVLLRLPSEPIEVGSTWREDFEGSVSVSADSPLKKPVKMQRRFSLTSVEKGIATIQLNTVILSNVTDPDQLLQLIRRQPRGVIKIDLNRGVLLERTVTQDNQVQGFGEGPNLMTFKQTVTERLNNIQTAAATVPAFR